MKNMLFAKIGMLASLLFAASLAYGSPSLNEGFRIILSNNCTAGTENSTLPSIRVQSQDFTTTKKCKDGCDWSTELVAKPTKISLPTHATHTITGERNAYLSATFYIGLKQSEDDSYNDRFCNVTVSLSGEGKLKAYAETNSSTYTCMAYANPYDEVGTVVVQVQRK